MEFEIPAQFTGAIEKDGNVADSKVWSRLLAYTLDYDRQIGLDLGSPFESTHRFIVQLPPAYRFETVPIDHEVRSRWGTFRIEFKPGGEDVRRLVLVFHTRLDQPVIQPADLTEFVNFRRMSTKSALLDDDCPYARAGRRSSAVVPLAGRAGRQRLGSGTGPAAAR